jgi:hypothetical protein
MTPVRMERGGMAMKELLFEILCELRIIRKHLEVITKQKFFAGTKRF